MGLKMKILKLASDKVIKDGRTIVYNRTIIEYDSEGNKTPEQKYMEANIHQFYDWINPNLDELKR